MLNDIINYQGSVFLSHKSRHEQIDNKVVESFEKLGFYGD